MAAKQLLERGDLCLDLDHQRDPGRPVPGEHVDRTLFAIDGVGELGNDLPALCLELTARGPDHGRVHLVEQAVELAAAPMDGQGDASVQHLEQVGHAVECHAAQLAALEIRYVLLAHADPGGDVSLAQALPATEHPKARPARTASMHAMVGTGSQLALI